jgi:hypothetical protein
MPGAPGEVTVATAPFVVGQFMARSQTEAGDQFAVSIKDDASSALSTAHYPISTALVMEQVFGSLEPLMLAQENPLGQPGAILNSGIEGQADNGAGDQALLQLGVAQHDWVPADMVVYFAQAAKAGRRSPFGGLLDGGVPGQDGGDEDGVERFFAAAVGVGNGST